MKSSSRIRASASSQRSKHWFSDLSSKRAIPSREIWTQTPTASDWIFLRNLLRFFKDPSESSHNLAKEALSSSRWVKWHQTTPHIRTDSWVRANLSLSLHLKTWTVVTINPQNFLKLWFKMSPWLRSCRQSSPTHQKVKFCSWMILRWICKLLRTWSRILRWQPNRSSSLMARKSLIMFKRQCLLRPKLAPWV